MVECGFDPRVDECGENQRSRSSEKDQLRYAKDAEIFIKMLPHVSSSCWSHLIIRTNASFGANERVLHKNESLSTSLRSNLAKNRAFIRYGPEYVGSEASCWALKRKSLHILVLLLTKSQFSAILLGSH